MSKHQIVVRPRTWTNKGKKKTGSVWQVDFQYLTPDGQSRRVRQSFDGTKAEALTWGEKAKDALSTGKTLPQKYGQEEEVKSVDQTFSEFADEFIREYVANNNKPSEQSSKRFIINNHLKPFFGELRLSEVTERRIEAYKATKRTELRTHAKTGRTSTLGAKTINNQLIVLSRILRLACEYRLIKEPPKIRKLKQSQPDVRAFTREQVRRLLERADGEWRTMIMVAVFTGLRLGELRGLRWEDVDLFGRRLHVRQAFSRKELGTPKNGKPRTIDLADEVHSELKRHLRLQRGPFVFSRPDGSPLREADAVEPFRGARDAASIGDSGWKPMWHACRHTFISWLVADGMPLNVVQQLAGHYDIKMTMRYAHLAPGATRRAVQCLNLGTKDLAQSQDGDRENTGN